jgi:hypothetical protein
MRLGATTATCLWWLVLVPSSLALTLSPTASLLVTSTTTGVSQQITPLPVVYASSCAAAGTWYLQGGYHTQYTNATYSLDLTIPWNITQAPWVQLPSSPNISTTNCIISVNGTYPFQGQSDTVVSFFGNENSAQPFMSLFDVSSQTWIQNGSSVTVPTRSHDLTPIGDPLNGKIYIRGGYRSDNATTMDVYDPKTNSFTSLPLPPFQQSSGNTSTGASSGVPIAQGYAATWCSRRSSILYFGGRFGEASDYVSPSIFEYVPANNTWSALPTTGQGPTGREDACVATGKTNPILVCRFLFLLRQ